jgi:lipopolysaccharide exporter
MTEIRRRMAGGAVWMVLFKALERSLGLISMLFLARMLAPSDFGLVAMATSLIALLELFSAFGLDTALIQRVDATLAHYHSAWTLNLLAACTIAAMMLLLAWPASHFYREPRVAAVICVLAAGAVIQGLENVGVVDFRKQMRFDREFRFLLAKKVIAFCVTLPLAFWLRNYWALVFGTLVGRAGGVTLSYVLAPFRPRLSLSGARDLMRFSKWLLLQNFLSFLRDRSPDFIIGRLAGPHDLGTFSVSAEISNMPGTELVAPINRAVLPAYARLAKDLPALRREYLSVMGMVAVIAVPAVAGFAVCAPFLVLLLLGPNWMAAAGLIQVLGCYGIGTVLQSNAYSAFIALDRPNTFARITSMNVVVLLALLGSLTPAFGIRGAAWAYVITVMIVLPINLYYITKFLGLPVSAFASQVWRPICGAVIMYIGVRVLGPAPPHEAIGSLQAASSLLACIALGVPLYIVSVALLWLIAGRPEGSAESWCLRQVQWVRARAVAALGGGR